MDKNSLSSEQRLLDLELYIDPGFINYRKTQSFINSVFPGVMEMIDNQIRKLPDLPVWQKEIRIAHIYTETLLILLQKIRIKTLQQILYAKNEKIFCSTEKLKACKNIYETQRAVSIWENSNHEINIEFQYSTDSIFSSTLKTRLHSGAQISIIAELYDYKNNKAIFEPLIMGFPYLRKGKTNPNFDIEWYAYDYYEIFIDDIDEFKNVKNIPEESDCLKMKVISEYAIKKCFAKLFHDSIEKDWGGEKSDFFSSHISLNGKKTTASFLLKGPAKFQPMTLNHLGKNNDQIVRLASEPSHVLIVQHCHDITTSVRSTLRAFAVQPYFPRQYCLIDGRDTLRILNAYNLLDYAIAVSNNEKE